MPNRISHQTKLSNRFWKLSEAFGAARKPRAEEVVDLAEKMDKIYQLTSDLPGTVEEHFTKVTPEMWQKVWNYSVKEEIEQNKKKLWS